MIIINWVVILLDDYPFFEWGDVMLLHYQLKKLAEKKQEALVEEKKVEPVAPKNKNKSKNG